MPPKQTKPTTTTAATSSIGAVASGSNTTVVSNLTTNEDDEDDSRPQTPMDAMDFSNYEHTGVFIEEMGQHNILENERKSEVFTAIGYTCSGLKVVVQAWAPYDKDIFNFMK
jgi:hypothetical protein